MNMPPITMVSGGFLIALGIAGYVGSGMASVTALIPAFFGLLIFIAGALALKEAFLKHAMHAAAMLGVLGFVAPLGRIIPQLTKGGFEFNLAGVCLVGMALVSGVFTALCVKSFIDVRRARQTQG